MREYSFVIDGHIPESIREQRGRLSCLDLKEISCSVRCWERAGGNHLFDGAQDGEGGRERKTKPACPTTVCSPQLCEHLLENLCGLQSIILGNNS